MTGGAKELFLGVKPKIEFSGRDPNGAIFVDLAAVPLGAGNLLDLVSAGIEGLPPRHLVSAQALHGLLEAPLTSTVDVARTTYFWLPLGLLITDKYDIEHNIRSVTVPILIVHGEQDAVIPVEMGWWVYRAANS